ncbi:uncharacterized protein [Typha angustifolia]|uniref:uncharacterized protein n=1 Tax=Typha angustifolia TaxID=59011 RepID=UPI003C2FF022
MVFSLLLLRRASSSAYLFRSPIKVPPLSLSHLSLRLSFSSLPLPDPPDPSTSKPPSLSSRLAFVFDQIDSLDRARDHAAKDDALLRIRAWRQAKDQEKEKEKAEMEKNEVVEECMEEVVRKEVELVHPWPEWIELMERLAHQNYFDLCRADEDQVAANAGIDISGVREEVGLDFSRDWITVRNACMNFGRDRFDILKSLSRKDIQILVGHGCPSMDPKVVFSAKLLRKLVHLDEGDVCSSCSLRNSCGRGYILTRKEDEARTLDVMRVLLTFGFDHVNGTVENKPLMKMKSVKTVVRKLIHEVVKLSAVPIDPNLPPPVIKKPPPKVKQPPPPPKKRVGRDDVEMKKGDWLCPKCDFMNFAKNTVCLQCDAKRPKRQLLPGEWECPRCNFLNYRRNMACFHCEHKRPPDEYTENQMEAKQSVPRTGYDRAARMSDVSNAWNFDFDDNEEDGADVAAFEFADSSKLGENSSQDNMSYRGISRGFEDDAGDTGKTHRNHDRWRSFSEPDERKSSLHSRTGFDDFDDEDDDDDDDVDSYEIDTPKGGQASEVSRKSFSEFEMASDSEEFSEFDRPTNSKNCAKDYLTGSEDDDLGNHPYWKPSRPANVWQKAGSRGGSNRVREMPLGSDGDDELISDSDGDVDEGFRSKQRGKRQENPGRAFTRQERISFTDDKSDDNDYSDAIRNKSKGPKSGSRGSRQEFQFDNRMSSSSFSNRRSRDSNKYDRGSRGDSYGGSRRNDRSRPFDGEEDQSWVRQWGKANQQSDRPKGSRRNGRGSNDNRFGGRRDDPFMRSKDSRSFGDRERFDNRQRGRNIHFSDQFSNSNYNDDRPRRRVIER